MSKYAIRQGHQFTGEDKAAEGILKEIDVIRAYAPYVIKGLKLLGHTVIDVTPPEADRGLYDSLSYGIDKSNYNKADYFVSLHANCVSVVARGCEVVYGSSEGSILAQDIVSEFVKLGFPKHQGAYKDQRGLAEIKKTDAVAVIVEPFFVSNSEDVVLYEKIGPEKLGYAVVKGLTGKDVMETSNTDTPTVKGNDAIKALQYDLNIDYNAKLTLTGIVDSATIAALKGIQNVIVKGHKSHVVLWIQQKLVSYGYLKKGSYADMIYDEPTFQAVTNMQKNWGRPTDGILLIETWNIFLNN